MKTQELSSKEKLEINGGSDAFSTGSEVNIGSESLISLSFYWKQGSKENRHTLEAGKDIDFSLGAHSDGVK